MLDAIVLDCGGVIVYPTTGDWVLSPGFTQVLGDNFMQERLDEFRSVRARHVHLLPDANCMQTDEQEYLLFMQYYDAIFAEMGISLTDDQINTLAHIQTYRDDRYGLFDDVLPFLDKWHRRYKLGIVSDAPPSTRRILTTLGVMDHIDGATFSCDMGILKPDPRSYMATLDKLCVSPKHAVFVDDYPSRLRGAEAVGMHCVQMRREMPQHFAMPPIWEGHVVHSFAQLDALLVSL